MNFSYFFWLVLIYDTIYNLLWEVKYKNFYLEKTNIEYLLIKKNLQIDFFHTISKT
jgi:hypothetical protein